VAKIVKVNISASKEIAEVQLEELRKISRNRPLDLQETKKFEILVKTLALATQLEKENPTAIDVTEDASEEDLLAIATGKLPNVITDSSDKGN
jgi:putative sterol carrier protein